MNAYQTLTNEIDSLIRNSGTFDSDGYSLRYDDLDEDDQQKITACFIDCDDRDLFSVYENEKYDDIVASMLSMLKKGTHDSEEDFTKCLKKNVTAYYATRAQNLINERCAEVESSERWTHGQTKRQDRNTGEFNWLSI
jgi:hypothetical protein